MLNFGGGTVMVIFLLVKYHGESLVSKICLFFLGGGEVKDKL